MARHHDQIRDCLRELAEARDGVRCEQVRVLDELLQELIEVEERLVFARFEAVTGLHEVGPTWSLRREHQTIRSRLGQLLKLASDPRGGNLAADLTAFEALIADHLRREEVMFGGLFDQLLDEKARHETLRILRVESEGVHPARTTETGVES